MGRDSRGGIRQRLVAVATRSVLLADLSDSVQDRDSYTRVNCEGLGRIRRFSAHALLMNTGRGVLPRRRIYRTLETQDSFETQVFQLAGCNWRCWYCFVDDGLLDAIPSRSRMTPVSEMVERYLLTSNRPQVLDLSGGQPDLVPEWALWTMQELEGRGLRGSVHVWMDDNLSGDFMSSVLGKAEIKYMAGFPRHSRAGCFKGIDDSSMRANSGDAGASVRGQLRAVDALLSNGFDPIFYVTLTGPIEGNPGDACRQFLGELRRIHPVLPLKVVPLEVRNFAATLARTNSTCEVWRMHQWTVLEAWEDALAELYAPSQLSVPPDQHCLLGTCSIHSGGAGDSTRNGRVTDGGDGNLERRPSERDLRTADA